MMIRAADLLAEGRRIPGMSGASTVTPDWEPVAQRIRDEATDDWNDRAAVDRFEGKGGHFVRGTGRITGRNEVTVNERVLHARCGIVIATGTEPAIPPIDGLDGTPYWTNREAIEAKSMPESMIVLGGGAIGLELAQAFRRFGAEVTVVEALDRLLATEEPEAGQPLAEAFAREGIAVRTGAKVTRVGTGAKAAVAGTGANGNGADDRFTVHLDGGGTLEAERLLVATGRRTDLRPLGIASVSLDEKARFIEVDERMRAADGVWAVGDVTGRGAFTHVAMYQAGIAIRDILGVAGPAAEYDALPRVTFSDPEVGAVGLTEKQAHDKGLNVREGFTRLPTSARGWIHKAGNDGFIKLVEDADRGVLVGGTSVGPTGGEVLSALAVAVHGRVPTDRLRHMIYAYPTFHRAIGEALMTLG
jgi:pyruvate/2-oxoglutarate dehydrogenase complex dihydrolipoamide dehydrogenase (E3) component